MKNTEEQGLVIILTGNGKGKTTSALGSALRASGQGLKVLIIQFIKAGGYYGEIDALENLPNIEIRSLGLGLIGKDDDPSPHRAKAREAFAMARAEAASGKWDLLILDELCNAMYREFVSAQETAELIQSKSFPMHLFITGRNCPKELFELADTVTYMEEIKHHMGSGIPAQAGIEY